MTPSRLQGAAYVLFAIVVWSGWVLLGRYSAHGSLSPYDITALRFGTAGIFLLPVLLRKGISIGPYGWKGGLLLAFCMGAPYNTIAMAGMHYAPASHAAAIINTVMLTITTLGGIRLLKEKTTALRMCGVLLSILGIGCMLYSSGIDASGQGWMGSALFILGGSMWAVYALSIRSWHADPLHATTLVCVLSFFLYMPIYFLFIPSHISMDNIGEASVQAAYQGILNSILALLCYNKGVRILGATVSSAFLPLVFILSTLLAIPLLGETPGPLEWTGIALASIGVFFATGIMSARRK